MGPLALASRAAERGRGTLLLAPLLLALGGCGAPDDTARVLRADRERAAAQIAADPERLRAVLHERLRYTHSTGQVDTRDSLVESLRAGRVDYRVIEAQDPEVRLRDGAAIVTGPVRMEIAAEGRLHRLAGLYTAVYWWEAGRWQLVAYHSGPAPSVPPVD